MQIQATKIREIQTQSETLQRKSNRSIRDLEPLVLNMVAYPKLAAVKLSLQYHTRIMT